MKKHWNKVFWKVKIRKFDLYESKLLRLSSKKAKKVLHWEPALKFNETIKMTTNWTRILQSIQLLSAILLSIMFVWSFIYLKPNYDKEYDVFNI